MERGEVVCVSVYIHACGVKLHRPRPLRGSGDKSSLAWLFKLSPGCWELPLLPLSTARLPKMIAREEEKGKGT